MHYYSLSLLLSFVSIFALTNAGKCTGSCPAHNVVYEDLRCIPKYNSPDDCCAEEYDCSHIYNRPAGTCHFQGKFLRPGEAVDSSISLERCDHASCRCAEQGNTFSCVIPSDSCAEFWVPEFLPPGCYLTHEFKRCCNNGRKCPPFNDNAAKCVANGVTYQEGQQFNHPTEKCKKCICDKNFNEKIDGPYCRQVNCTTELLYSKEIQDYCAPIYTNTESCCPSPWICPSDSGSYIPASKPSINDNLKCKFGMKTMGIGEKYQTTNRLKQSIDCECIIPPYLTCSIVRSI